MGTVSAICGMADIFGFALFAKGGFKWDAGMYQQSRGFLRAPQVSLESYRSLVRSEVPRMVQFRLRNWWILGFFWWCSRIGRRCCSGCCYQSYGRSVDQHSVLVERVCRCRGLELVPSVGRHGVSSSDKSFQNDV